MVDTGPRCLIVRNETVPEAPKISVLVLDKGIRVIDEELHAELLFVREGDPLNLPCFYPVLHKTGQAVRLYDIEKRH